VGIHLSTQRLHHGELNKLAQALVVSTRTLRNWRYREGRCGSPGRRGHSQAARQAARELTERARRELSRGHDGWRSVCARLKREGVRVPVRLVQESLRALKHQARQSEQARISANRVHVDVLVRDAVWALDQTHLSRDEQGELKALLVREGMVPHTLGLSIGKPACGADVVRLLEHVASERGAWPFVIQLDNGPENRNDDVRALLRAQRVMVLWNEPRTPQHNARAERSIGSLKRASGLGRGSREHVEGWQVPVLLREGGALKTRARLCVRLLTAWHNLDARTPRATLHGLTPVERDKIAARAEHRVCRARFYAEVCEELRRVALAPLGARARRRIEREVIWCALQSYGLITRTRGGCLVPTLKAEGIS
jgi:hypothetical protein